MPGVPKWYDWDAHSFVSVYLGTKGVKDFPPHDYQEANHFRFLNMASLAYQITNDSRYIDLVCDYCDRWAAYIESADEKGPIPCSILPEGAEFVEMGYSGVFKDSTKYQIFYSTVAENTMYDIVVGFFNAYKLTGNKRYLAAGEKMMGQFILNGNGVRPAQGFSNGAWRIDEGQGSKETLELREFFKSNSFIPELAVLHNQLTGQTKYKELILKWAADIDEGANYNDQSPIALLCAAHYFSGDASYLARAYNMALRAYPLTEWDDQFHQCNSTKRQGSKNTYLSLYFAMVGDGSFATRGSLASQKLRYYTGGKLGLPAGVAMRVWLSDCGGMAFEAVNSGSEAEFEIRSACGKTLECVTIAAGEKVKGVVNP